MRRIFWLKSSLMPYSLAFITHGHICVNNFITKINTKIACNIFFGRYCDVLQVKQPIVKFQYSLFGSSFPLSTKN